MIRPIILARASRYIDDIGIRVAFVGETGKKHVLIATEGIDGEPFIELVDVEEAADQDSFLLRVNDLGGSVEAQNLMDSLWDAGIRPTQAKGSAGQLTAVQAHLADMRQAFWEQHKLILELAANETIATAADANMGTADYGSAVPRDNRDLAYMNLGIEEAARFLIASDWDHAATYAEAILKLKKDFVL